MRQRGSFLYSRGSKSRRLMKWNMELTIPINRRIIQYTISQKFKRWDERNEKAWQQWPLTRRNANSSFCSFCRSAEGCWPFPRINFNIVAPLILLLLVQSGCSSSLVRVFFYLSILAFYLSLTCTYNNTKFHSDLSFLFQAGNNSSSELRERGLLCGCGVDGCCVMIQDLSVSSVLWLFLISFPLFTAREV